MRRKNAISVRVRNPSRGLVTRLPSELADEMRQGDINRTFYVANNVRFEDGVVAAAPGYKRVVLATPLLEDLSSHWRLNEIAGEIRIDSHGDNDMQDFASDAVGQLSAGKIGAAAILQEAPEPPPTPGPIPDFDGGHLEAPHTDSLKLHNNSFTYTGWMQFPSIIGNAQIVAQGIAGEDELIFERQGTAIVLRLSDDGTNFTTLTHSVIIAIDTWYFFAIRFDIDSSTVTVQIDAAQDTTSFTNVFDGTGPLVFGSGLKRPFYLDSVSFWQRDLSDDEIDEIYNDGDGLDYPFLSAGPLTTIHQGNIIDSSDPKPLTVAAGGNLYEATRSFSDEVFTLTLDLIYTGTPPTAEEFGWSAIDFYDKEIYAQHDNNVQYWKPAMTSTQDLPGLPSSDAKWDGVESFFGHVLLWRDDRFKWSALNDAALWIPVSQTAASFVLTIDSPGFTQPSTGGSATIPTEENPTDEGVVVGQYIRIDDVQSGINYTNYYQVTAISNSTPGTITATLLDLTGITPPASTIADPEQIFSVDANESGESQNVGSMVNGKIFKILAQGDYAYIFKERSIQSMQYVGLASGVFFVHPEIADEGLLSRNALLGLGDGRMIFVGHREIYSYQGGPTLTPIIQQFSRQFYTELDRSRLSEIEMFHKEFKNEVWIQYPVVGGWKILIWNYREDSATIDSYDPALTGITAIEDVEWPIDPSWASLADSITWASFNPATTWADMAGNNEDRFTLIAMGDGTLVIHGIGFNRDGEAYQALAETMDFDGEEPDIFKYVDVVLIGLQVKSPDTTVRRVWVQLGYRDWLDADITWTTPIAIQVQGNFKPPPIKLNPGGAGRFLRLRFYSDEADVPWRITSYEIHCRPGSTY